MIISECTWAIRKGCQWLTRLSRSTLLTCSYHNIMAIVLQSFCNIILHNYIAIVLWFFCNLTIFYCYPFTQALQSCCNPSAFALQIHCSPFEILLRSYHNHIAIFYLFLQLHCCPFAIVLKLHCTLQSFCHRIAIELTLHWLKKVNHKGKNQWHFEKSIILVNDIGWYSSMHKNCLSIRASSLITSCYYYTELLCLYCSS